jgi:amino acid adenylation domain-containing protein
MESSLHKRIHFIESAHPNKVALEHKAVKWTYREVARESDKVAQYLLSLGEKNPRIGLYLERGPESVIAILGIMKAGSVYVPLHKSFPQERLLHIAKDAPLSGIIGEKDSEGKELFKEKYIQFQDCLESTGARPTSVNVSDFDPSYIIYTSGSTGCPKGVLIPYGGITKHVEAFCLQLDLSQKDTVGMFAALTFDASISEIFTAYLAGGTLSIIPEDVVNNFRKFENYLNEKRITFLTLPPSYQKHLIPENINTLRVLISAGSATNLNLVQKWSKKITYVNAYGPSEGAICVTLHLCSVRDERYKTVPIGKPLNHVTCYLRFKNGAIKNINKVPASAVGELVISAKCLALQYVNQEPITAEKFFTNDEGKRCYLTGDIVELNSAGLLEFIGRNDKQLKIRGIRIEPDGLLY